MSLPISAANTEQLATPSPWVLSSQALTVFYGCPEMPRLSHYFLPRLLFARKQVLYLDGANQISPLLLARLTLPSATGQSCLLNGSALEYPSFDNSESLVKRLAKSGILSRDPIVEDTLLGRPRELSLRSAQRHFLRSTGVTYSKFRQIERARYATILLREGVPILDVVSRLGYFDQPHLTRSLRRFIKTLLKLFKNRFLDQITRSMIEDFKAGRAKEFKKGSKTQLVSAATVNRELGTLKKILNMAVDDELITINPARKVHAFLEAIPDVHILSFEEELNYLALASEPLKSVAIIMLGQGMRPDEVFRMTYSNLDFFNRTIPIVRGETKNAKRTLSMSQEVFGLLKARRQSHPDDYWVFPSPRKPGTHLGSVRKAHDNVCEKMGLRGTIDLYNLRHTFATRCILSGIDVTILQKILGHSEIGMTMRYVKIAEHYKVEAVVKLEKYCAVKMQEAVVKMQQEEEKLGMLQ